MPGAMLQVGDPVEVRGTLDDGWGAGFVVEAVIGGSYIIRRTRDGCVLPGEFSAARVRPASRSPWADAATSG